MLQLPPVWFAGFRFLSPEWRLDRNVQGRDLRPNQGRLICLGLEVREFQPERVAWRLEITLEALQIADLGSENRDFYPAIKRIVSRTVEAEVPRGSAFPEVFRLYFTDTLADPLGGSG